MASRTRIFRNFDSHVVTVFLVLPRLGLDSGHPDIHPDITRLVQVRVDWFMRGSAILLMFIAAGFFSASMHQLQELDVFGIWSPRSERPWQNVTLGGSVETDKRAAFR